MPFNIIRYTFLIFLFVSTASAQSNIDSPLKTADFTPPLPTLVMFANNHGIALHHIEIGNSNSQSGNGISVTFLLTSYRGPSMEQWLLMITPDSLTPDETRLEPLPDETWYTSTGRVFNIKNTRTAMNVNFIGPFTAAGSNTEKRFIRQLNNPNRVLISKEKLNCRLDRYAETGMEINRRLKSAGVNPSGLYSASLKPKSENQLEKGKTYTRIVHPTDEEERIGLDFYFALRSFYDAAMTINDFKKTANKVMDMPLLSIIFGNNFRLMIDTNSEVHSFDAEGLGIKTPAYEQSLKLVINGNVSSRASIIMTEPRPPLNLCAGIVSLYAEHPEKKENRLSIQLINTQIKP